MLRQLLSFLTFIILLTNNAYLNAQCIDIIVPDSSFESNLIDASGAIWQREDGGHISSSAISIEGNYVGTANYGGLNQWVKVDSHTTYYVSMYVKNGLTHSSNLRLIAGAWHPISPTSNNWELVSVSVTTGSDTLLQIGYYTSGGTLHDLFRVTCNPLVSIPKIEQAASPLFFKSNHTASDFIVESKERGQLLVLNAMGQIVYNNNIPATTVQFGQDWSAGLYIVHFQNEQGQQWSLKLMKY